MIGVALVMLERRRGRGGVPSGSLSAPPSLPLARWRLKMKGRAARSDLERARWHAASPSHSPARDAASLSAQPTDCVEESLLEPLSYIVFSYRCDSPLQAGA